MSSHPARLDRRRDRVGYSSTGTASCSGTSVRQGARAGGTRSPLLCRGRALSIRLPEYKQRTRGEIFQQRINIAGDVGFICAIAFAQCVRHIGWAALAVNELHNRCCGIVQVDDAFGDQQRALTVRQAAEAHALGKTRGAHAGALLGEGPYACCVASRIAHSTSHLNSSARTHASCACSVVALSTTQRSAYSASRGARLRRVRKYIKPASSIQGYLSTRTAMRADMRSCAKSSVSDDATDTTHSCVRANVNYACTAKRVPGNISRSLLTSSSVRPTARASANHRSMPPPPVARVPSWSRIR